MKYAILVLILHHRREFFYRERLTKEATMNLKMPGTVPHFLLGDCR